MYSSAFKFGVATYNVKHFKEEKLEFCKELFQKCSILCLQEHCLYKSNLNYLYKIGNINFHGNSAMDETKPLSGRPHGGCAIIWSNDLNCSISPIQIQNNRLCAIRVTLNDNVTLLIINMYLPCDNHCRDNQYEETLEILNLADYIISEQNCTMNILAGDLNAQMTRNTPHTEAVKNFLTSNELHIGLNHILANINYSFTSFANNSKSLIDHVCVCDNLFAMITEYISVDSVNNMSDHTAVMCTFDREILSFSTQQRVYKPRAAWHKARKCDILQYQSTLDNLLNKIELPKETIQCEDYNCSNIEHTNNLDLFLDKIIACCLNAEESSIPKTQMEQKLCIPGWNEYVKGKHKEALFWHNVWIDAGKPLEGELAENMRNSRHSYHYAIRYCRKNRDTIKATKMAEAMSLGRNRDFWREIKTVEKASKTIPHMIDNAKTKTDIANLFYNKFNSLYNSSDTESNHMENIVKELNNRISTTRGKKSHIITYSIVRKLSQKLKQNKLDGMQGFNSNCVVYGSKQLHTLLALYFTAMISHGYTSQKLLLGTICPIPKSNDLINSDKYRAIVLCNCISKLFDLIFIDKHGLELSSDFLQFGFKKGRSTTLCTGFMKGIAHKFVSEGSDVYTFLLDMSKAFDRVDHLKLFEIILERNMDPLYSRCLLFMYTHQALRVKWDDTYSANFIATNGIKQGGVLSPTLFCIYIDELINRLRASLQGCYIGPHFVGALAYADDLVLMSPTKGGLEQMLNICNTYAAEYRLSFNPEKSQFIVFRNSFNKPRVTIHFNETPVRESESVVHLGHVIYNDLKKSDSERILSSFYKQFNLFRSKLGHIPSCIQARLLQTYCSSFYGSVLMSFKDTNRLQVAWRKSLRQVWRIPYKTHCDILRCLTPTLCDSHMFIARFTKFILSSMQIKCDTLSFVSKVLFERGFFKDNIKQVCKIINTDTDFFHEQNIHVTMQRLKQHCNTTCKSKYNLSLANVIQELTKARDNFMDCILTKLEINELINDICVN